MSKRRAESHFATEVWNEDWKGKMSKTKMVEVRSFGGVVKMTESQERRCRLVFEELVNQKNFIRDLINTMRQSSLELGEAVEEYKWSVSGKTDKRWIKKIAEIRKAAKRKKSY